MAILSDSRNENEGEPGSLGGAKAVDCENSLFDGKGGCVQREGVGCFVVVVEGWYVSAFHKSRLDDVKDDGARLHGWPGAGGLG